MTARPAAGPLELVAERLRRDAEAEAGRIRAAARAQAEAILARARRDGAAAVAAAEASAAAAAAPQTSAKLRRAREAAGAAVLAAQRDACDELRARIHAAVAALPDQPGYDQLGQRIARLAGLAAGPDARLSPEPGGGFVARSPGVIVDCSLGRLADLALAELGGRVRDLWTP